MNSMDDKMTTADTVTMVIAVAGPVASWLLSDARSKSRLAFVEEKLTAIKEESGSATKSNSDRLNLLEVDMARCSQDRGDIHKMIERVDSQKASREVVDGIRDDLQNFKVALEKRFDKMEAMLERIAGNNRKS
jgi:hypothetical protein